MSTRIYLIRHGKTEWNSSNKFQGSTDVPLSELGIEEAKVVAKRLAGYGIEAIASSDLQRARDTAQNLADIINIEVETYQGLREINFGEWEGLTEKEIRELYDAEYTKWRISPSTAVLPGEGTLQMAADRGFKAIEEIVEKHKGKTVAVFAHASIIKAIILRAIEADFELYKKFWLQNTSISLIEYKDEGYYVLSGLNDFSHLDIYKK